MKDSEVEAVSACNKVTRSHLLKVNFLIDTACQTDCHILPPTQDKDYEWNEWEMRRKALKLANLRKCVTHSTQTVRLFMLDSLIVL